MILGEVWFDLVKVMYRQMRQPRRRQPLYPNSICDNLCIQCVVQLCWSTVGYYSLELGGDTQRAPTTGTTHIFLLPTTHTQVHIRRREYHTIIFFV